VINYYSDIVRTICLDLTDTMTLNWLGACLLRVGMADDDDGGRLSELSYDQLQRLHKQVLANWTQSDRPRSELDVLHVFGVRAALVSVYVVIIVVGILGNALVVVVAASRRPRSTSTTRSSLQVGWKRQKKRSTGWDYSHWRKSKPLLEQIEKTFPSSPKYSEFFFLGVRGWWVPANCFQKRRCLKLRIYVTIS